MDVTAETPDQDRPVGLMVKQVLKKIFLEDWVMKVVALAITLALWLGVTGLSTPTTELIRNVPLNLRFSSDIEVTGSELQEVDIIVSGDKRRVSQLNRSDLVVSVDLTEMQQGEQVVNLTPENVMLPLPTGIKLDEILPSVITVKLEPVIEKEVSVRVETTGEVADGHEIYSINATPNVVKVRGPASYVQSLETLATERISLNNRRSDFIAQTVQLNRPGWEKVTLLKGVVDVAFRIGERRAERVFLLPVEGDAFRRATAVLYGPRSVLNAITTESLRVVPANGENGEDIRLILPEQLRETVEIRQLRLRP